jgi:hypothetical protein
MGSACSLSGCLSCHGSYLAFEWQEWKRKTRLTSPAAPRGSRPFIFVRYPGAIPKERTRCYSIEIKDIAAGRAETTFSRENIGRAAQWLPDEAAPLYPGRFSSCGPLGARRRCARARQDTLSPHHRKSLSSIRVRAGRRQP